MGRHGALDDELRVSTAHAELRRYLVTR